MWIRRSQYEEFLERNHKQLRALQERDYVRQEAQSRAERLEKENALLKEQLRAKDLWISEVIKHKGFKVDRFDVPYVITEVPSWSHSNFNVEIGVQEVWKIPAIEIRTSKFKVNDNPESDYDGETREV